MDRRDEDDVSQTANCDTIPIIDLAEIHNDDIGPRRKLADAIYKACAEVGFFYIKNHGICETMIKEVHHVAENFFNLPEEIKMNSYIGNSRKFRGYTPLGAEKATGVDDDDTADAVEITQPSYSEAFDIGYEINMDFRKSGDEELPTDTYQLYGENQWPSGDVLPGFSKMYLRYCGTVLELCRQMMKLFALALDIPEDFFDAELENPGVTSRMIHYPARHIRGQDQMGLGAHTDYECFTILSQEKVAGLEVLNSKGDWISAPPIEGTLVVNIGDCLSTWSNKKFKSTIHRVNNRTGKERYSVAFFFGVDYDATVSVLENHVSSSLPACKAPFKAGEWVRSKLSKAYVGYDG